MNEAMCRLTRRDFLAAVGASGAAVLTCGRPARAFEPGRLRAGAAAVDVTPGAGVVLDGTIMQIGPAIGVHDPLFARCLVLDNGAERVAIATADCTMAFRKVFDRAKKLAHEKTGIATENMVMATTHSHSAVRAIGIGQGKEIGRASCRERV